MDATARREIDNAKQQMLERLGDAIAADAARYAPRRTGHLASTVHRGHTDSDGTRVEADADYAGYVELGTRYQRAQPFLRPALLQRREGS